MGSPLCDHLAGLCLQYDLHSKNVNNNNHSRIPLCNNYASGTAVLQCLEQGLCECQTCASTPNFTSRYLFLRNGFNNNPAYNCPLDLDLDSSSSSLSSIFDRNWTISCGSIPLYNEDSSSSFEIHTKNYSDQQVLMLQPQYLDIPKDSSCLGFNSYETEEDIENVLLNTFDSDEAVIYQKEDTPKEDLFLSDQLIDIITKHNAETTPTEILSSSGMSSVIHKDYSIESLANASSQDYYKNQTIGSNAKEETNNFGIFPDPLGQLDCGQSQLILTDEMLPWEDKELSKRYKKLQDREEAKKRYFAKKKKRKFGKKIRYESRKSTADTKRRMKGRFTKAGAEYDYDPRSNNVDQGTNK